MKARVIATGEIVEVMQVYDKGKPSFERLDVLDTKVIKYSIDELDFSEEIGLTGEEYWEALGGKAEPIYPDYWTRLEHQYAGMAMQSYVSNNVYLREIREMCKEPQEMRDLIADLSILLATTLIQKLKESK